MCQMHRTNSKSLVHHQIAIVMIQIQIIPHRQRIMNLAMDVVIRIKFLFTKRKRNYLYIEIMYSAHYFMVITNFSFH